MNCKAVQYSDQKHCKVCRLTWDMNDPDPPPCSPHTQLDVEYSKSRTLEPKEISNFFTKLINRLYADKTTNHKGENHG